MSSDNLLSLYWVDGFTEDHKIISATAVDSFCIVINHSDGVLVLAEYDNIAEKPGDIVAINTDIVPLYDKPILGRSTPPVNINIKRKKAARDFAQVFYYYFKSQLDLCKHVQIIKES